MMELGKGNKQIHRDDIYDSIKTQLDYNSFLEIMSSLQKRGYINVSYDADHFTLP